MLSNNGSDDCQVKILSCDTVSIIHVFNCTVVCVIITSKWGGLKESGSDSVCYKKKVILQELIIASVYINVY